MAITPQAVSAGVDLVNSGFAIANLFGDQGGMAKNDARFMNDFAWKQALRNEDFQKNNLQWRVRDAELAGISPLAAIGSSPGGGFGGASFVGAPSPRPKSMPELGQNLARAAAAQQTPDERALTHAAVRKAEAEAGMAEFTLNQMINSGKVTAAVGSTPAVPDPWSKGYSQGDIHTVPQTHQLFMGPGGPERGYTDEYSRSMQSRPWASNATDLANSLYEAAQEWPTVMRNVFRNLPNYQIKMPRRSK